MFLFSSIFFKARLCLRLFSVVFLKVNILELLKEYIYFTIVIQKEFGFILFSRESSVFFFFFNFIFFQILLGILILLYCFLEWV